MFLHVVYVLLDLEFDFLRRLWQGALLAPHWNPRAAEIGVITKGEGVIQIAFPNGTNALNRRVGVGSLFFVPQYYPMCQIASRSGPFEFVGFSTSATKNKAQFLAGDRFRPIPVIFCQSVVCIFFFIICPFTFAQILNQFHTVL